MFKTYFAAVHVVNETVYDEADAGQSVKQKIRFLVVDMNKVG